ncbi:hypothetical protein KALB_5079 [Kutzneria albida DSM 43870]|uniref:Secreted protein n=1 Tax=Kutzneria albida DSM 43870 TaxID=1449976 RepID=W5WCZ4_9PSEU|nr:hypothetical protein KALB_5079 [Kutzneria albida DSM 43870]
MSALAGELLGLLFTEQPVQATLIGVHEHDERLPELDESARQLMRERAGQLADRARDLLASGLPEQDRITAALVVQQAEALVSRIEFPLIDHVVASPLSACALKLLLVLPLIRPADEPQQRAYLARLAALPEALGALADRQRQALARGHAPVASLVRSAIRAIDRYLDDPGNDPLRRPELADHLVPQREQLLTVAVRPAYARYRELLATQLLGHARPDARPGLCWLPGGKAAYARLIRDHTTTELTADQLHRTGLDLIERLDEEYREIGGRAFGLDTAAAVRERLLTDPGLRWRDEAQILAVARDAVARAHRAAPGWFGRLPEHECLVEPVPAELAADLPAAYYTIPSVDGARLGTYFANTSTPDERERYTAEATAFHEAVPGHHFQFATTVGRGDLPLLRRFAAIGANVEGWGLYAERLAEEMGLYSDDVARLGMLAMDSLRAARLVVDTGLHALGWSREQALDYLRENTAQTEVDVVNEVDRYIENPGQALGYMVGRLEIQRLRGLAERTWGADFDLRAFHDLVLGAGIVPLDLLAELVREWRPRA